MQGGFRNDGALKVCSFLSTLNISVIKCHGYLLFVRSFLTHYTSRFSLRNVTSPKVLFVRRGENNGRGYPRVLCKSAILTLFSPRFPLSLVDFAQQFSAIVPPARFLRALPLLARFWFAFSSSFLPHSPSFLSSSSPTLLSISQLFLQSPPMWERSVSSISLLVILSSIILKLVTY